MNDVSRSMTRLARINKDLLAQQVLLTHFQIVKVLRMITTYCREQTGQGVTKQEADITMKVLNQFLDGLSLPQK
jgi:hypothetical protein